MLRRESIALAFGSLIFFAGHPAIGQTSEVPTSSVTPRVVQATESGDVKVQATGTIPAQSESAVIPSNSSSQVPAAPAPVPLTPAEQKAADNKAALDALLAEASALKTSYESTRRSRNKTQVSLSAFRSMELRLQMAAAADPANVAAIDMANAMRMAQYEILQPSVQIAAIANRELYVHEMGKQMQDNGMKVTASGRGNNTVRFMSPHMTLRMAMQLVETAKIPEQAKALQFSRVVFSSGRRSWTYNVARGSLR